MTVQYTDDDGIVTGSLDGVIRTYDSDYHLVKDKAGEVEGQRAAENNGQKAVVHGNVVKVVDKEGIVIIASRNYALNLQNSNVKGAIGLNDMNKQIWEQHNERKAD